MKRNTNIKETLNEEQKQIEKRTNGEIESLRLSFLLYRLKAAIIRLDGFTLDILEQSNLLT